MLTVSAFKSQFFDRAVMDASDQAGVRVLSRFGAFVRRRDKSSLKYKEGKSVAGTPPHVHRTTGFTRRKKNRKTGATTAQPSSPLRELTFFGYDPGSRSVLVGPALFAKSKVGGGVAPRLVEEGGTGKYVDGDGVLKIGHFAARPHLGPSFKAEYPKLPQMFKDSIK